VICWIDDLGAWMRSATASLRPGGRLALVDIHPVYQMIERVHPLALDFPYAHDGPRLFDADGSYADRDAKLASTESVQYAHSLGEVVTFAVHAGLRVERLEEHLDLAFDPRGDVLPRDEDGRYRLRLDGELLPVAFTFLARRP
jgi:SAM-dependent methyltransferase